MKIVSVLLAIITLIAGTVFADGIKVHASKRYFQDESGKPVFLIGYYNWASVADGYYIDHPSRYSTMINDESRYKLNYIRISLGINRFAKSTDPSSWNGRSTPVPFLYVNGKADLDRWDNTFWNGLKAQCRHARRSGVIVHVSIFDGVELRGGKEAYRYVNSFWKPSNQIKPFYDDPDINGNGNIDEAGEFYRLKDFENNTGIGFYQKKLIDKVIAETSEYDNVFYEIGNELLSSSSAWNTAVINYIKTRTDKAVSQCGGEKAADLPGLSQHSADTPAQVKSNMSSMVGLGYPAWEDPDGPALSDRDVSADDLRRAAWYAFTGGAACWGGFTVDYWTDGRGLWKPTMSYYRNLQKFIKSSRVKFWEMEPCNEIISNPDANSCLANKGFDYIIYVLNDPVVTIDLSDITGKALYRIYNPKTGIWSSIRSLSSPIFNKPSGADDWVIYIYLSR